MTTAADERAPSGDPAPSSSAASRMRALVAASRSRSLRMLGSPDRARPDVDTAELDLDSLRQEHPLAPVYDVLRTLLIEPATSTGLIVAITDASGRLVWVDGDRSTLRKAERMAFVPGADWSEPAVGTSAPGTALASGDAVQVAGDEHFAPAVQSWHCSAVPVRSADGDLLGVIDVTGGVDAIGPHSIPLLRAAAAAATSQLRLRGADNPALRGDAAARRGGAASAALGEAGRRPDAPRLHLRLLGRDRAVIQASTGATLELSPRHSEIMLLLATHPAGLRGPELAAELYRDDGNTVTLRAELARLRSVLTRLDGSIRLSSQPYRLNVPISTDAADVLRAVDRGAHRQALRDYAGDPLPTSDAPGVEAIRERTSSTLREAVLDHGNVDAVMALLDLPGHADDVEANLLALKLLSPRSPKRAAIVARLEALEA